MQPVLGRGFRAGDDRRRRRAGHAPRPRLWRERIAARRTSSAGRSERTASQRTVIGVMPARFAFPIREALWVPLGGRSAGHAAWPGARLPVLARLKRGRASRQARPRLCRRSRRSSNRSSRQANRERRRRRHALRQDRAPAGDLWPALHDAGGGHRRAADRLRQRLEPAGGAGVPAPARGRGPDGARRAAAGASSASTSPKCSCSPSPAVRSAYC